jgi:hypothetical protein
MYLISEIMVITCLRELRIQWNSKSGFELDVYSVDRLDKLAIFENLLESNQTLLIKDKLFLMACYTSVQIYKNY